MNTTPPPVVILTGLSGAGKSTALNVFEDLGFFCVDGLPASIIPSLVTLFSGEKRSRYRGLALGMDLRQLDFLEQWALASQELTLLGVIPQILFVEAADSVLVRRYATTRRPHPLEVAESGLEQAIAKERAILLPVREKADLIIDTSEYSVHDLRRIMQDRWNFLEDENSGFKVHIISFGFKYGVPAEADIVLDLRFLPNPYFNEKLRPFSGKDLDVAQYVLKEPFAQEFVTKLQDFLAFLLPLYAQE
ncbi:MAG: RNase adapter RapZ, partial [Desulfoplanes sp.]